MKKVVLACMFGLVTSTVYAGECSVDIEATASMSFSLKEIPISKKCSEVTINLKNGGTLAKNIMGHNLVIAKSDDMTEVLKDGSAAGLDKNYVKENDARVIANTKVIGGGETASVKFKLSKMKTTDNYMFFCSFPGHASIMKGAIKFL